MGLEVDRQADGQRHGAERPCAPHPNGDAEPRSREREHHVLGQQQAHDAPRPRTERQPHAHLALPRARPRQHQVRRVPAHGHEQQQHDALQERERRDQEALRTTRELPERQHFPLHGRVRLGVVLRQLPHRRVHIALRLRTRGPGREQASSRIAPNGALVQFSRSVEERRRHRRRQPQVELQAENGPLESARGHADDRDGAAVDANVLADRRRRAREARLPVLVRDDRDRIPARFGHLVRTEEAPGRGPQAERVEVVPRDQQAIGAFHLAGFANVERRHPERQQVTERAQAFPQILVLLPGRAGAHAGFGARLHEVEARRVRNSGYRLKDDRLDPREDDDVDAYPDAKGEDDHERDAGHARDHPPRMPDVAASRFEPGQWCQPTSRSRAARSTSCRPSGSRDTRRASRRLSTSPSS